jgi:very-short-patch-repair endonuclease
MGVGRASHQRCIVPPVAAASQKHWRASIAMQSRARQLRREMTPAEIKLWQRLRGHQLRGAHFRKQHAVGNFIVDFFCARAKLVIEIDGDVHALQEEYDAERTQWLKTQRRYRVMRFANDDVLHNIESVLEAVAAVLSEPPP